MTVLKKPKTTVSVVGLIGKSAGLMVKFSKLILAAASIAAYTWLFTWQFALIIIGMLFIHEYGHLQTMKYYHLRTRGIYMIPFLGAAAVSDDAFPSRKVEATVALAGPIVGGALAILTGIIYFFTHNGYFAAASSWMALVNLFNLLPVNPLDGGRVWKSVTHSIGSKIGLVSVIAGMLAGAVLAFTQNLIIFAIILPLGMIDYAVDWLGDRRRETRARERAEITGQEYVAPKPIKPTMTRSEMSLSAGVYLALAVGLWGVILLMSGQPGAAAAMHALQG